MQIFDRCYSCTLNLSRHLPNYYFAVEAFNENGVSVKSKTIRIE